MLDPKSCAELKMASRELRVAWRDARFVTASYVWVLVATNRPKTELHLKAARQKAWRELWENLVVFFSAARGVNFHPVVIAEMWWYSRYIRQGGAYGEWVVG